MDSETHHMIIPAQLESYVVWVDISASRIVLKEPVLAWSLHIVDGHVDLVDPITARGTIDLAGLPAGIQQPGNVYIDYTYSDEELDRIFTSDTEFIESVKKGNPQLKLRANSLELERR